MSLAKFLSNNIFASSANLIQNQGKLQLTQLNPGFLCRRMRNLNMPNIENELQLY
jgi:hypothetical protein